MAQKGKHINKENFIRYISDKMEPLERNRFERLLQQYPFEAEAFEGMLEIEPESVLTDLDELNKKISHQPKSRRNWYRAAAAILILFVSTSIFFVLNRKQSPVIEITENKSEREPEKKSAQSIIQEPDDKLIRDSFRIDTEALTKESALNAEEIQVPDEIILEEEKEEELISPPIPETEHKILEISAADESQSTVNLNIQQTISGLKIEKNKKAIAPILSSENISLQNKFVKGVVLSAEDSTPLPGVAVWAKGTTIGGITDVKGNFNLNLPSDSSFNILTSYIGMEDKEITNVPDSENIIYMEPSKLALDEVVVVGSGKRNRSETTSSVSKVETQLEKESAYPEMGLAEFKKHLKSRCIFPEDYNPQKKVVRLELTIDETGEITNIKSLNSPDSILFQKSVDIINEGFRWNPAKEDGIPVKSTTKLRLKFRKKVQEK